MATHPEEQLYIYEPEQDARARELLLWQHQGKPRLTALVEAFAAGAQLAENTSWAVLVGATTVQGAEGATLDRWGELAGEFRGGLTDAQFRRFLDLRVQANSLFPNEDLLYTVLKSAVSAVEPTEVALFPSAPGGIKAIVYSRDWLGDSLQAHTAALIHTLRPAGTIAPVIETIPGHMALDWEPTPPVIPSIASAPASTAYISSLIYSGRGPR